VTVQGTFHLVDSVPAAFAELVASRLAAIAPEGMTLFLSGGETAEECYGALAAATGPAPDGTPRARWSSVDAYWGDERCVPLTDPDSNHRLGVDALLSLVGPVRSDHPMYRGGPPEEAAAAYDREVRALDRVDLVHLGLGPDAHCASLFPGTAALDIDASGPQVVTDRDPTETNRHDRITLTLPGIARGELVVFTVSGESKRDALRRVIAGEDVPAGRVTAKEVVWLVDEAAVGDTVLPGR
jgi:6-phosphogluconolactonase